MKPKKLSTLLSSSAPGVKVVGITGGIASGKSQLARVLRSRGYDVIDADLIARSLTAEGGAGEAMIKARFGTSERTALAKIIFSDAKAKQDLEAILHPLILRESIQAMSDALERNPRELIFYEAALIIETRRYRELDGLVWVRAAEELRLERLKARDEAQGAPNGASGQTRLNAQMSDEQKQYRLAEDEKAGLTPPCLELANEGSLESLEGFVETLLSWSKSSI